MLSLTILGNNSALPAFGRNPTAQWLQTSQESILIDCGEGTQSQLSKYKLKPGKLTHIFISHLHGDHYFGLIGLLTSMSLLNRSKPIHLYGPAPLQAIIQIQLDVADTTLSYPLHFHALDTAGIIASTQSLEVSCFKVSHSIECWGFMFTEKKIKRSVDAEKARSYEIPAAYFEHLQQGKDYITKKGTIIHNAEVTTPTPAPKRYAYCADTKYNETLIDFIKDVDLLYHETTYLKDQEEKAALRFHSTTLQAAQLAKLANVKQLMIGHFSAKYESTDLFLLEAKSIFENTILATEGSCYGL